MIECSFAVKGFSQGGINASGNEVTSSIILRSDFAEIPIGLQSFSGKPEFWLKKWDKTNQMYVCTEYEGTNWSCSAHFYDASYTYMGRAVAKENVDFLKYIGAKYVRFTVGLGTSNIYPDSLRETTSSYYYLDSFSTTGTAVQWHYEDGELYHDDLTRAPEKAMTNPYPKALWRIDNDIPYHELLPIEKPSGAFMNAKNLEYVRIARSVQKIGKYAFTNTALRKVKISAECEYSDTSFPENCLIEFYDKNGSTTGFGQLYDCDGHVLIDADGARIYVEEG